MIKKEETEAIIEIVEDIICDVTGKSILADVEDDDYVYHCSLTLMKIKKSDVITEDFQESIEFQSSEMCKEVYDKTIDYLKSLGGKVPSNFENNEPKSDLN